MRDREVQHLKQSLDLLCDVDILCTVIALVHMVGSIKAGMQVLSTSFPCSIQVW